MQNLLHCFNAYSSSWYSGISLSLLFKFIRNSDPGVRIVFVHGHDSDLNSMFTVQITRCNFQHGPNFGFPLDPSYRLWYSISCKSSFSTNRCIESWELFLSLAWLGTFGLLRNFSLWLSNISGPNSFIQSCFKEISEGGRGDAYIFSNMPSPVSILTTFGVSWKCFMKNDGVRSCLIELQSFLQSKVDVDPIHRVLIVSFMLCACIVQLQGRWDCILNDFGVLGGTELLPKNEYNTEIFSGVLLLLPCCSSIFRDTNDDKIRNVCEDHFLISIIQSLHHCLEEDFHDEEDWSISSSRLNRRVNILLVQHQSKFLLHWVLFLWVGRKGVVFVVLLLAFARLEKSLAFNVDVRIRNQLVQTIRNSDAWVTNVFVYRLNSDFHTIFTSYTTGCRLQCGPRIHRFGSNVSSYLGKVHAGQATASVTCQNSVVSFVI